MRCIKYVGCWCNNPISVTSSPIKYVNLEFLGTLITRIYV